MSFPNSLTPRPPNFQTLFRDGLVSPNRGTSPMWRHSPYKQPGLAQSESTVTSETTQVNQTDRGAVERSGSLIICGNGRARRRKINRKKDFANHFACVCQFPAAHANAKSLKVKDNKENAGDTLLERRFMRDGLDVSVKGPPSAADKLKSLIYSPPPEHLLSTENKVDGRFFRQRH